MCKWFNPRQRNRRGEIEGWGWGDEDIEPLNFRQLESLWPADTSVSIFNEAKYPPCKKWNQLLFIFLTFLVDWHETSNHYLVLISLENLLTLHMYGSDNEGSWNLMDTKPKVMSQMDLSGDVGFWQKVWHLLTFSGSGQSGEGMRR